jgi:hypothetical protein
LPRHFATRRSSRIDDAVVVVIARQAICVQDHAFAIHKKTKGTGCGTGEREAVVDYAAGRENRELLPASGCETIG